MVVDASTALAWCFPDESSEYGDAVLVALKGKTILAPAIWSLEIANAVLVGERRKRIRQAEIEQFAMLLGNLPSVVDTRPAARQLADILPLARRHGLSAYDSAYLELAIRQSAPLATLDAKLRRAAKSAGVETFSV